MDPVAFTLGSLSIRWYGIMAACGFLSGVTVARFNAKLLGIKEDYVTDLTVCAIVSGIIGARLFYVIQFWHRDGFDENFMRVFRIDNGGLVYYGGFLLAVVATYGYCRFRKIALLNVMDLLAPAMACGHIFGRIGCFINGCCYGAACGDAWPLGVHPKGVEAVADLRVHPVQLYESAANAVIFVVLFTLLRKRIFGQGGIVGLYFLCYAATRFLLEFLRGDHRDFLLWFTPAQSIGLVLMPIGAWLVWRSLKKTKPA